MTTFLLDVSVLIALTAEDHEHHRRASTWAKDIDDFAVCPIVQGALVRFVVRLGGSQAAAMALLAAVATRRGHTFWADDVSYLDLDLGHVIGHRQVSDAYLLGLVRRHPGSSLVTLDRELASIAPADVLLLP